MQVTNTKIYKDVAKKATDFLRLAPQISIAGSVCKTAGTAGVRKRRWDGDVTVYV